MKNYYVLKKITVKDLPYPEMFDEFDDYVGTCQIKKTNGDGVIYVCTDGSEIEDEQIRIDLYEVEVEEND